LSRTNVRVDWEVAMTSVLSGHPDVIEPTEDELREGMRRALKRSGFTYAQLAEQARTGRFKSLEARLTWMAVRHLGDLAS
jgi:hypothetical protein